MAIVQVVTRRIEAPTSAALTDDTVLDLDVRLQRAQPHPWQRWQEADSSVGRCDVPALPPPRPACAGCSRGEFGNEISWLLPVALFVVVFGGYLWARGHLGRDERAAYLAWSGWLLVTGVVFTFMNGTVHPYYTVALAPAVAALIGLGSVWAWRSHAGLDGRIALAVMLGLAGWWSVNVLNRDHFGPVWMPMLITAASVVGISAALIGRLRWSAAAALAGALGTAAGMVAFSIATAMTPHHGAIPNAVVPAHRTYEHSVEMQDLAEEFAVGGWMGDEATNRDLADLLRATRTPWSAATNGSQSAAALEIASGTSVMAIGGWGGDPAPTLEQFIADVQAGKVAYYVEAGKGGAAEPEGRVIRSENHSASHTREIADWVAAHYRATTLGESLVYRLV